MSTRIGDLSKNPEAALHESRGKLEAFFSSEAIGVTVRSSEERFLEINDAFCEMVGYSREELMQMDSRAVTHPEDVPRVESLTQELLAGRRQTFIVDKRYVRKDGSIIWVHNSFSLTRDAEGAPLNIVVLSQDVTERKRMESQLQASEQRFAALLNALPVAVYTTDRQGLINYYNRAATQLSGRTPILGSDRWCVSWRLYHPDGTPLLHENCPMNVALQENRPINGAEILVERPDGTRAPVMVYPAPLRDGNGELAGGINTLIDITERKRYEEHLKLLIEELNHRVKNTLSIVQSLAQQTFRSEMDYDDVRGAFEGRLSALAAAHDLLTRRNWDATNLADLARSVFDAFSVDSERALIEGPEVRLEPKTTISIAMALHELVTNAAKYGALSTENGRVSLKWQVVNGETPRIVVCWQESGGPPVKPPERRGFGSRMIERALAYELSGTAELEFRPAGLVCRIDAPLPKTRAERWPN